VRQKVDNIIFLFSLTIVSALKWVIPDLKQPFYFITHPHPDGNKSGQRNKKHEHVQGLACGIIQANTEMRFFYPDYPAHH
jgi:hypothetical protein